MRHLASVAAVMMAMACAAGETWKCAWREVTLTNDVREACDVPSYGVFPGFKFSFKVRLDGLSQYEYDSVNLMRKGHNDSDLGTFIVRADPRTEGGHFAFFISADGSPEPRLRSRIVAKPGEWYAISGSWDGQTMTFTVNGETVSQRRTGEGATCAGPVCLGKLNGVMKDVVVGGPAGAAASDGHLAPGFGLSCDVTFDRELFGENTIVEKPGEYLLRYDRANRDREGEFRFFARLDDGWEPRCVIACTAKTGAVYSVAAGWDGFQTSIQVNGKTKRRARTGTPKCGTQPVRLGARGIAVSNFAVACHRRAYMAIRDARTKELMPRDGEPFDVVALLDNVGDAVSNGIIRATVSRGAKITPAIIPFASLAERSQMPLEWHVEPGTNRAVYVNYYVESGKRRLCWGGIPIYTMPKERPDVSAAKWMPPIRPTRTWYVDSRQGSDDADGLSPATAWKSFARVSGKMLGPGERLLLKRGSVFNEELVVTAKGEDGNWAEIGAYGEGARPILRRNRDIDDRCAHVVNPSRLVVRDLTFCWAGKGLDIVVHNPLCAGGILVERCLAHHIEGLYYNAHGIPEWKDRFGATGPGDKGGINLSGRYLCGAVMRDCETYGCSFGFRVSGSETSVTRIYCHDNVCHNTSPHPFLTGTRRSWLTDSVFERSGWNASAGTMGIMLGGNMALEIANCHFLQTPDSGCPDEGGIDFECAGHNYLVDRCTFRQSAGAAIEVLGLKNPQSRNVHIRNCRFDRNNWAKKLGPSEIYIWGGSKDPSIVCSSGMIEGNGYVLEPGVCFYTNRAERTRANWELRGNRQFATSEELNRAMHYNDPPSVSCCAEIWTDAHAVTLSGKAADDALPAGRIATRWEQLEGPCAAKFDASSSQATKAYLPEEGDYRFNLYADDGEFWRTARTAVHVLAKGTKAVKAWSFARNHDFEGWTAENLGTKLEMVECGLVFRSEPVNIVAGDYYTFVAKDSANAAIVSPDCGPNCGEAKVTSVLVKMQNHTNAKSMRLSWRECGDEKWSKNKSVVFGVRANDTEDTRYDVALPHPGKLRQVKIELSPDGEPVTGTCRIDYIVLIGEGDGGETHTEARRR